MKLQIRSTDDGSPTIFSEYFKETYHSSAGAVTESVHVFIHAGLMAHNKKCLSVLEVGFGTGLNALLTLVEAQKHGFTIDYTAIELYPLEKEMMTEFANSAFSDADRSILQALHQSQWNLPTEIAPGFFLTKIQSDLLKIDITDSYDLVYFDAFSPAVQPELWTEEVFEKLFQRMCVGGILTTYCAKGAVRRAMQKAGFLTERLPGPPPKREMLRAQKMG